MASTGLLSLGLATSVARFLDENRDTIWNKEQTPLQANLLLASRFTILFLASILVSFFYHLYFQSESLEQFEEIIASVYRNTFVEYLMHNGSVLLGGVVLAFIYRAGGLLLLLFSNGLTWGMVFAGYLLALEPEVSVVQLLVSFFAMIPHILFEVSAYVLAGMSAIFLSKAMIKYHPASSEFRQVAIASVSILLMGAALLVIGCLFETYLAQPHFPRIG